MPKTQVLYERSRGGELVVEESPRTPHGPAVTINVTEGHLKDAKQRDSGHCMTADAIKDALPGVKRVSVDLQTIRFSDPKRPLRYTYLTPRSVQFALVRFDRGDKTLGPFTFRLQGAHVTLTPAGRRAIGQKLPPVKKTQKQIDAARLSIQKAIKARTGSLDLGILNKTQMARSDGAGKGSVGAVPRRVGGKPPPMVTSPSLRREFGLRALIR